MVTRAFDGAGVGLSIDAVEGGGPPDGSGLADEGGAEEEKHPMPEAPEAPKVLATSTELQVTGVPRDSAVALNLAAGEGGPVGGPLGRASGYRVRYATASSWAGQAKAAGAATAGGESSSLCDNEDGTWAKQVKAVDMPGVPTESDSGDSSVSVEINGLKNGEKLTFRVQPYYEDGGRQWAPPCSPITLAPSTKPPTPQISSVAPFDGGVYVKIKPYSPGLVASTSPMDEVSVSCVPEAQGSDGQPRRSSAGTTFNGAGPRSIECHAFIGSNPLAYGDGSKGVVIAIEGLVNGVSYKVRAVTKNAVGFSIESEPVMVAPRKTLNFGGGCCGGTKSDIATESETNAITETEKNGALVNEEVMSKGDTLKASEEAWKRVLEFLMKQPIATTHEIKALFRVESGPDDDSTNGAHVGELMKGLKGYGLDLTKFQARAFYSDCDANRDGVVTLTEFNDALRLAKKRKDEESHFEMISAAAWDRVLKYLTSQSIEVVRLSPFMNPRLTLRLAITLRPPLSVTLFFPSLCRALGHQKAEGHVRNCRHGQQRLAGHRRADGGHGDARSGAERPASAGLA